MRACPAGNGKGACARTSVRVSNIRLWPSPREEHRGGWRVEPTSPASRERRDAVSQRSCRSIVKSDVKICSECRAEIDVKARRCRYCGAKSRPRITVAHVLTPIAAIVLVLSLANRTLNDPADVNEATNAADAIDAPPQPDDLAWLREHGSNPSDLDKRFGIDAQAQVAEASASENSASSHPASKAAVTDMTGFAVDSQRMQRLSLCEDSVTKGSPDKDITWPKWPKENSDFSTWGDQGGKLFETMTAKDNNQPQSTLLVTCNFQKDERDEWVFVNWTVEELGGGGR